MVAFPTPAADLRRRRIDSVVSAKIDGPFELGHLLRREWLELVEMLLLADVAGEQVAEIRQRGGQRFDGAIDRVRDTPRRP